MRRKYNEISIVTGILYGFHRLKIRFCLFALIILFCSASLTFIFHNSKATPEFALWTGKRCSECHINFQGGGMRKDFGWQFGKDASFFVPDEIGLQSVYDFLDKNKYSYFDGKLAIGTDDRYATFRSQKTDDAPRRVFPMQASIYANSKVADWLRIEGQYNFGPKMFNGQRNWAYSFIFQPDSTYPALRAGMFQPSIGIRDCDMTSLDRRIATPDGTEVLIAPDFAEYGAEIIYEGQNWLTLNAGIFDSRSLAELSIFGTTINPIQVAGNPSLNIRAIFYPKSFIEQDWFPYIYIGGSSLINGEFVFNTAFAGIAVMDDLHVYGKLAVSNMPNVRLTENYIAGITYMPFKGILLGLRGEAGNTFVMVVHNNTFNLKTWQGVLNAKIFLLPYFELIPEYRFINCEEYKSLRWALQLHFYY